MAWPAQRLQVAIVVCAAVSFGFDMVNCRCRNGLSIPQTFLTQVSITLKDAGSDDVPLTAIASLVAATALLVLLPAFVAVSIAVAGTVCGSAGAPAFTAGARDSCWHIVGSNKKATSYSQWLTTE